MPGGGPALQNRVDAVLAMPAGNGSVTSRATRIRDHVLFVLHSQVSAFGTTGAEPALALHSQVSTLGQRILAAITTAAANLSSVNMIVPDFYRRIVPATRSRNYQDTPDLIL
jgi:hypothetical protein